MRVSYLLDVIKDTGAALLAKTPAGAAALTLVNAFLPDDKKLGESATGNDAKAAYANLPIEAQVSLASAKITQAIEEDKGRTARYIAMTQADGQETRAQLVKWAMLALIALSLIFIASVAHVYNKDGAQLAFSDSMAFVFLTVVAPFAYVVRSYFGDLRGETESRHLVVDDKPRAGKGLVGIIQSLKG